MEPDTAAALRENCGDREVAAENATIILLTLSYECESGLSDSQLAQGVAALRADPAVLRALRLRTAQRDGRIVDMQVTLETLGLDRLLAQPRSPEN